MIGKPWGECRISKPRRRDLYLYRGPYNRCRWYTAKGRQVGPEQANVVPAFAWAYAHGYRT